jgi:hypothetical protein
MKKKIIKLTESDLLKIIDRVIFEQTTMPMSDYRNYPGYQSYQGMDNFQNLSQGAQNARRKSQEQAAIAQAKSDTIRKIATILDNASNFQYGFDVRPGGSLNYAQIIYDWAKKNTNFDANLLIMTLILFNRETNFGNFWNKLRFQNWGEPFFWADSADYSQKMAQIKPSTAKQHNLNWDNYKSGFLGVLTETYNLVTQYYNALKNNYTGDKVTKRGPNGYYQEQGIGGQAINTLIIAAHNSNINRVNHRWCKSSSPDFYAGPCKNRFTDTGGYEIYGDQKLLNYVPNFEGEHGSTYKYLRYPFQKLYHELSKIIPYLKK